MRRNLVLAVALTGLSLAAPAHAAEAVCGDVNDSGTVSSSDAQAVLRFAVGQPVDLICGLSGGVLSTSQSVCYDVEGVGIDCVGTGHDGESQAGLPPSFTDNADGTISDGRTGLMWEKLSDDGGLHDRDDVYTWPQAFDAKIAALNEESFAGYDDWRLPNRFELDSLVNLDTAVPATHPAFNENCQPGCTVLTCSCTRPDYYWTSSTYLAAPSYAWTVYFNAGDALSGRKTTTYHVRAVRGGL